MLESGAIRLDVQDRARGTLDVRCTGWDAFRLDSLSPSLRMDHTDWLPEGCSVTREDPPGSLSVDYSFGNGAVLGLCLESGGAGGIRVWCSLQNAEDRESVLNHVTLLGSGGTGQSVCLGPPLRVRILEQGNYWARVRPLVAPKASQAGEAQNEPAGENGEVASLSDLVWVAYDRSARMAFLAGFETSERWLGRIELRANPEGQILAWSIGFDGGDLLLDPGEEIGLEVALLLAGTDPWRLLETYAERVARRHNPRIPQAPPVSWCSWYPYRLGVTEERILENARIAAQRLRALGLSIIQVDLGWERGQLPNVFEENDQFPHGLASLSAQLAKLGFDLGVWKAPFTISEHDSLVGDHPEWLIRNENGQPASYADWHWTPHGKVFILDLTHPGAQEWLKRKVETLAKRQVRYLKADFIGCVSAPLAKRRHDSRVVAGGGTEAARIGARIIREALPDALVLNCGGPEMPGTGHWPLLYACRDTGNTGFLSSRFQETNYHALACHLFKNRRWGILQPSCLCVGLPGTSEEARLRATVAFLAGGQIDISDTLTTLPEERWDILTATLPPLGITARPVDLFEPVGACSDYDYTATCKEGAEDVSELTERAPGSVWHVHVETDWDEWDLVGVFSFHADAPEATPHISHFAIPLPLIGLSSAQPRWGYEFWGRQFLGRVPSKRANPGGYAHPGDSQDLLVGNAPETLALAFFGPGAKLLCLRKARAHPWVVGTTFHQSCGAELERVAWDRRTLTLSGEIHRPKGQTGFVVVADAGMKPASRQPLPRPGAKGCWHLPITIRGAPTRWQIRFRP